MKNFIISVSFYIGVNVLGMPEMITHNTYFFKKEQKSKFHK